MTYTAIGTVKTRAARVVWMLEELGQPYEYMAVRPASDEAKGYNPSGKVPVLVADGVTLTDSVAIMTYLADKHGQFTYPAGSLAAHYLAFTQAGQIDADGLADVSKLANGATGIELTHPYAWFARRTRDVHDFWHILTGYDLTALGEAALVAFSYAQTRALGWAVIATGAALTGARQSAHPYARTIWEGYQRGKAAKWLLGEDYEAMLGEQLEPLRARLGLNAPKLFDAIPIEARNKALPKR